MRKAVFMLSAAFALAGLSYSSPSAAAAQGSPAKLRLPPPKAPKDQIYSPGVIAQDLQKRGYRIESMRRLGTTYSITATGPSKNKVQMTVDGRSGEIIGLAVLQAAPNLFDAIAALVRAGTGARYVDDWHPFGIIVPDTYQTRWTVYPVTSWTTTTTAYVPEAWSGKGYRFAVPYRTVRPGARGKSKSTIPASKMRRPAYSVRDSNGTEMSTEYSEETTEITETTTYETTYESENESLEEGYLGGAVGEGPDDVDDITDYDSEDGDFDITDNQGDDYDADIDDDDNGPDADEPGDDNGPDADEPDDDNSPDADEPDDDNGPDADDGDDDGSDEADDPGDDGSDDADDGDDGGDDDGGDDDGGDDDPGMRIAG